MSSKVAPPKSLKVSRSKNKYTFSWTRGEKYSKDQKLQYKIDRIGKSKNDKWKDAPASKITKNTTKYSISVKKTITNLDKVSFRVKGITKKGGSNKDSKWADKTLNISKPDKPKIVTENPYDNTTIFNYGVEEVKTGKPLYYLYWESILSKSGETPNVKTDWSTLESKDGYSGYEHGYNGKSKSESYFKQTGKWEKKESFTSGWVRHFKVKSCGPGGESDWATAKHAYNRPNAATGISCSGVKVYSTYIDMTVSWDTGTSKAKPVTKSIVQYYIGTLGTNLVPTGGSWQDTIGGTVEDYPSGKQSAAVKIDNTVSEDHFLWIHVRNFYDNHQIDSDPELVLGTEVNDKLARPSNIEIEYDSSTYRASIKATNNSQAVGSFLVVRYNDADGSPNSGKDIGIISSSQATTIQCPNWTGHYPVSFGIRAMVGTIASAKPYNYDGTYTTGYIKTEDTSVVSGKQYYNDSILFWYDWKITPVQNPTGNPHDKGYYESQLFMLTEDTTIDPLKSYYEIDIKSKAAELVEDDGEESDDDFNPKENNYYEKVSATDCPIFYTFNSVVESYEVENGGETPVAPQNVAASQLGTKPIIHVTWDNQWDEATGAEIAWADHDDALYSTAQPSTFTVSNIKRSQLNIADLELGKTWYVWVRLFKTSDDGVNIYSEYSDTRAVNLSSAPNIPDLEITPGTISKTDGDNGKFICSWKYESNDGTDQESAIIYEVTEVNGNYVYTPLITDIKEQQTREVTIDEALSFPNWELGSIHNLSIQVRSTGGVPSGYSPIAQISLADPITLSVTSTAPNLIDMLNPETFTGTSISEALDSYKDVHNFEVTVPYTGTRYYGVYTTQTAGEDTETIGNAFGTRGSNTQVVDFYGGTYNLISGVLVSEYDSSGTLLDPAVSYNVDKLDFTIEPADTNSFESKAYIFAEVANPVTEDIEDYYELDTETDLLYFSTSDEEVDPLKTYYELVETGSALEQSVTVADNDTGHKVLRDLPLTVSVDNISKNETVIVMISREDSFEAPMPDENEFIGYEGETVFLGTYNPGDTISIDLPRGEDYGQTLTQKLDDEGTYVLNVIASDLFGQVSEPINIPFIVNWANQAITPEGIVEIDNVSRIAKIKVLQPTIEPGDPPHDFTGDSISIYRLSGDAPKLIYSGASFYDVNNPKATTYVDPYPTIGSRGGYRIVLVTKNGDYITPTSDPAWIDIDAHIDSKFQFIDFGGEHIDFIYNVNLDNSWDKSFTLTHYLGGSIQGDWVAGVERSSTVKGMTFDDIEPDTYDAFRDLAEYVGICHVRTIEGSNYTANIKVSDSFTYNSLSHQHDISLDIKRCDSSDLDGITLTEWEDLNS